MDIFYFFSKRKETVAVTVSWCKAIICFFLSLKRRSTAITRLAVLLLRITGAQSVLHTCDPLSADSELRLAVSWCHRAVSGWGKMATIWLGSAQEPGLAPGSASQQATESLSQLLPPFPQRSAPVSTGGEGVGLQSPALCSGTTENQAISGSQP